MTRGTPDYYKSILLYGLYDGAPVPLACDEQGRLVLVSEHVSPFRKTGTIVLADDFSEGLIKTVQQTSGTGAAIALDDTEALTGAYSVKLTGGADANRTALIGYYVHPSSFTKLGIEAHVRLDIRMEAFRIEVAVRTGTERLRGTVRYSASEADWQVYDYAAGEWVTITTGVNYAFNAYEFIPVKFIVDVANARYHRLYLLWTEVDLSDYSMETSVLPGAGQAMIKFELLSQPGENGFCLLDNIIITQDES